MSFTFEINTDNVNTTANQTTTVADTTPSFDDLINQINNIKPSETESTSTSEAPVASETVASESSTANPSFEELMQRAGISTGPASVVEETPSETTVVETTSETPSTAEEAPSEATTSETTSTVEETPSETASDETTSETTSEASSEVATSETITPSPKTEDYRVDIDILGESIPNLITSETDHEPVPESEAVVETKPKKKATKKKVAVEQQTDDLYNTIRQATKDGILDALREVGLLLANK